ncbi:hypothetical protein O181_129065 [Austropuccinia psidii MF-1]|uniref:Uncharacterized protein n=1 Tax=Austropuccinia psidii MF-1 TaxID=1389203 RepID=A0A9Q3KWG2_9BASI|nr:hypothetical protein [Austropuccinia psidii MF-1]
MTFKDLIIITKGWNQNREFKLLEEQLSRIRENEATIKAIEEQLNQTEHTLIPLGLKREKARIKREKQDFFEPEAERVRPHDQEAVGLVERSTQEPEIVVNTSNRIRRPADKNITPTQNENNSVKPESNIKINKLWLKISQFSEKTQQNFARLQENNVSLK